MKEIFDEDVCNQIREFQEQVKSDENTVAGCKLSAIPEKDKRKRVHDIIRKAFPLFTSDTDGDCVVLYSHKNQSMSFNFISIR